MTARTGGCDLCNATVEIENAGDGGYYAHTRHEPDCVILVGGAIPWNCSVCRAELLNPHELTGLCLECKLVLRNERLAARSSEFHTAGPKFPARLAYCFTA
jgi:hypothetical protein